MAIDSKDNKTTPSELEAAVHIWYQLVGASTDTSTYLSWLSEEEKARYSRFNFDKDRLLFLTAHGLKRSALSQYEDIKPQDWIFETTAHGKPLIKNTGSAATLRFNLSHTKGLAVCAVTRNIDVGVDVENTSRIIDPAAVANRFFSSSEVSSLLSLPKELQKDRFLDYWTLKEAYIKARGLGLALPLGEFSFTLNKNQPPQISFTQAIQDSSNHWQFTQTTLESTFRLAVAVNSSTPLSTQIQPI